MQQLGAYLIYASLGVTLLNLFTSFLISTCKPAQKKRLSDKLVEDGKDIIKKYNLEKYIQGDINTSEEYEMLLFMLRKEIDLLKGDTDKKILQKTLDRKNFNNQKRYAKEIFTQAGLLKVLRLK